MPQRQSQQPAPALAIRDQPAERRLPFPFDPLIPLKRTARGNEVVRPPRRPTWPTPFRFSREWLDITGGVS